MDSGFCVDCLAQALGACGAPEIFNRDQGGPFTPDAFTEKLKEHGVAISRNGRGRALDNLFVERLWRSVKYEDVYLKGYAGLPEWRVGLASYFEFYHRERRHPSPGYLTPDQVYRTGIGGGAGIVDHFNGGASNPTERGSGQCRIASRT